MATNPPLHEEILLVRRSKEGDHAAFGQLYDLTVDRLFRFMTQFSRDEERVRDWVQRAFIRAYENLSSFDGLSLFSTWLFKLALNEMRMDFRREKIVAFVSLTEDEQPQKLPQKLNEEEAFHWEMTMKHWLAQLDETKRAVFILFEVEGYSHSEIAGMLGIRESSSRTILARTKHYLRGCLEEERKSV
jgi:RNA polymerase sigma-70 factor (ECF subfamily)